ncbi:MULTISPECIES: hypothetical protein [Enterobacterales]|uniref:hypothetical protein n=1 Tax=Enterobacterales TaxID=91347 RepID=UPI00058318F1|nr:MULTISPECIES: hypothetical protein [Enterobacterales]EFK7550282.1 hypothetical protein [Escherichia coli]KHT13045.1 hypothetical protein RC94_02225 [Pectobacterium brasiliense]MBZ7229039.1 hypothetical protein [Klebsiella michiganensis]MDW2441456.1 hypothetical protein [Escherichia coli]MDY4317118.1 hypothetical protein [Pectobacterium actinidiae]
MKNLPDSITLEELLDVISKEMEGTPSEKLTEKLIITIGMLQDVYDIDENANNYILYSVVGLEEQSNKRTLTNAQAAQKIINKKKQGK